MPPLEMSDRIPRSVVDFPGFQVAFYSVPASMSQSLSQSGMRVASSFVPVEN
jgi:hypothetical protein